MTGIIGKKLGMVGIYSEKGDAIAGTVIEAGPCVVTALRTPDHDGYQALQLGFGAVKEKHLSQPVLGQFRKTGIEPKKVLREFRGPAGEVKIGDTLTVAAFQIGERVKVTGISKGRGFAGVIKRYNFKGPNQSHGTHESFRGPGAIGAHSYPARVFPGKRLPGHMGNERVTAVNLKVAAVDVERNLLVVAGAVPGAAGGFVEVRKMGGA